MHELLEATYRRLENINAQRKEISEIKRSLSQETSASYHNVLSGALSYLFDANQETDIDKKDKIYREGIAKYPQDANLLGDYANFLCDIRHAYDQAEVYYKRALEADSKNAITLGNYAHFLITCRGDLKRADSLIQQAFETADNNEGMKPLQAELWFYRYAHYYEEWGAEAEKELAALLNAGAKSIGWNLAPDIELARKNRHPHIEQVEAFAKALTEEA